MTEGKLDRLVQLTAVPMPDEYDSAPTVFVAGSNASISYTTSSLKDPDHNARVPSLPTLASNVQVTILDYYTMINGPVLDEALTGHPLKDKGLKPLGVYEVRESSWIRGLAETAPPDQGESTGIFFENKRHYIFTFLDNVVEFVAGGFAVEVVRSVAYMEVPDSDDNVS